MAPSAIRPDLLLRLPRELRDEIYSEVLKIHSPLPIKGSHFKSIPPIFWKNSILHCEALETFYKVNTFTLDLEFDPNRDFSEFWGPYPQSKQHIRHLIVSCDERYSSITDPEEYEHTYGFSYDRRRWAQFLELPHLQSLTINLQKAHDTSLFTLDFGPVLYRLRELRPEIDLTFNISFDDLLRSSWNDPWWQQFNPRPINVLVHGPTQSVPDDYQPMGFIDVSDLIALPTGEDRDYVKMHLSDKKVPAARSVSSGLLGETPANRRAIGRHYAVKEPALLRVLMEEHYEVYKKLEKDKKVREMEERIFKDKIRVH